MFIPFVLATSCVVIAAAAQFHTQLPAGFVRQQAANGATVLVVDEQSPFFGQFRGKLAARDGALGAAAPPASDAEKTVAATLLRRDAIDLAKSLKPLTGAFVANIVFGLGVLGMVLSTISILMLISGFVFAEMFGAAPGSWGHRVGTLVAGVGGALWPVFWTGESGFFLAVVTSVFAFMLLPFAYVTFVFLLNSRSLLKGDMPTGMRRLVWNVLMTIAASVATVAALYMIWVKGQALAGKYGIALLQYVGFAAVVIYALLAAAVWLVRRHRQQ